MRIPDLAVAVLAMVQGLGSPLPGSPTPDPAPARLERFACPAELFPFATAAPAAATVTASPDPAPPLPAAVSAVGGARLGAHGLQADLPDAAAAPPTLRATAWLVADLDTGDVLAACNAHVPLAPASTLKLLTALALMDAVPAPTRYTATQDAASVDGTRAGLVAGSRYTADDLWHGLLMSSANDCAYALAELAGGQQVAARSLQRRARALGAADTHVVNTSGLDAPGQVSSVYDLAVFARAALAEPRIVALAQQRRYAFPAAGTALGGGTRASFQIQNHDRLLFNYPGATGLKNGWTSHAGGSFVGTAARDGHSYVAVILRADTNTWRATAALLDWAFATGPVVRPVGTLDAPPIAETSPTPSPRDQPGGPAIGAARAGNGLDAHRPTALAWAGGSGTAQMSTVAAALAAAGVVTAAVGRRRRPRGRRSAGRRVRR